MLAHAQNAGVGMIRWVKNLRKKHSICLSRTAQKHDWFLLSQWDLMGSPFAGKIVTDLESITGII
jgi:hypothetical protein